MYSIYICCVCVWCQWRINIYVRVISHLFFWSRCDRDLVNLNGAPLWHLSAPPTLYTRAVLLFAALLHWRLARLSFSLFSFSLFSSFLNIWFIFFCVSFSYMFHLYYIYSTILSIYRYRSRKLLESAYNRIQSRSWWCRVLQNSLDWRSRSFICLFFFLSLYIYSTLYILYMYNSFLVLQYTVVLLLYSYLI